MVSYDVKIATCADKMVATMIHLRTDLLIGQGVPIDINFLSLPKDAHILIGVAVSEEKVFEKCGRRRTGGR